MARKKQITTKKRKLSKLPLGVHQKRDNPDRLYVVIEGAPNNGKRAWKWITIKREPGDDDEAFKLRAANRRAAELEQRRNGATVPADPGTVAEYLTNKWLPEYARPNLGGRTVTSYEGLIVKHIIPTIGSIKLRELTPLDVQGVYTVMSKKPGRGGKKISGTTRLHAHRVLRKAIKDAEMWGLVRRNVADAVKSPTSSTERREVAPLVEALPLVLEAADATDYGALVRTLAWTGMRLGEALGLRFRDVDFEAHRLRVVQTFGTDRQFREPKSRSSRRTIMLDPEIVDVLREHKREQTEHYLANGLRPDHDLVFASKLGNPLDHSTIERAWHKIIKSVKLSDVRLHDLRHSHATLLLDRQTPLNVVQERLGHAQASTTANVYGHALSAAHEEAAGVMSRVLAGAK